MDQGDSVSDRYDGTDGFGFGCFVVLFDLFLDEGTDLNGIDFAHVSTSLFR